MPLSMKRSTSNWPQTVLIALHRRVGNVYLRFRTGGAPHVQQELKRLLSAESDT
jgi:hypothetical protein